MTHTKEEWNESASTTNDRRRSDERTDSCFMWRLPLSFRPMRTRTGVSEMIICKNCGWEIKNTMWSASICDDCAVDSIMEHNKEQGIRV
jgi:hypothetical protein